MLEFCRYLRLQTLWIDGSVIQLQAQVVTDAWCGMSRAYTQDSDIARFANDLEAFLKTLSGEAAFIAGRGNGIGLIGLRFYTTNSFGRVACQVRFVTDASTEHRPEELFRFEVEVEVKPEVILKALPQLKTLGEDVGRSVQFDIEYSPVLCGAL